MELIPLQSAPSSYFHEAVGDNLYVSMSLEMGNWGYNPYKRSYGPLLLPGFGLPKNHLQYKLDNLPKSHREFEPPGYATWMSRWKLVKGYSSKWVISPTYK